MDISLHYFKSMVLTLALLGLAFVADAQPSSYEYHQIPVNESLTISELPPGIPSIPTSGRPDHGSLEIVIVDNDEQVIYVPDFNFEGIDTFYFQVYNPPSQNIFMGFEVAVSESVVETQRDFAYTLVGTSTTIYPLENDFASSGTLQLLDKSPIYNNGTVHFEGNELEFTPNADFKGITHLGYIACNDFGVCDKGFISVLVHDYSIPSSQTDNILTTKGEKIPVILPYPGYSINQSPSNGTLEAINDYAYWYTPNDDYSGVDNFDFVLSTSSGESIYAISADVLDVPEKNNFAQDDYIYTPLNTKGGGDILINDSGNLIDWSLQITAQPTNGVAWLSGNGTVSYYPNTNYEGVDKFTYSIQNALGVTEYATVYATVSNFSPEASSFELDTYDDTPIYFEYDVPFEEFYFNIIETPLFGALDINYNAIQYTPVNGFSGTENFKLEYCTLNGDCFPFDVNVNVTPNNLGTPGCVGTTDCTWAGDTNSDGIVDGKDILFLCAIGEVGYSRDGGITEWIGQFSQDWSNSVNGVSKNIKHIDADGDSYVTQAEADVVQANYGKRNKITPRALPTQQSPLTFNSLSGSIEPGDTISIEVILGSDDFIARDYSGITFQMNYNPIIFSDAFVVFEEKSWLAYDAPVVGFSKIPYEGKLDVAFTRGDESLKSGKGHVATVNIVIDDLTGVRIEDEEFTLIEFTNSHALVGAGHFTKLNDETIKIQVNESDFDPELRKNPLNVYPNPTAEYVTISTQYYNPMKEIRIMNALGQVLDIRKVDTNDVQMNVSHLESGVYIIDVVAKDGKLMSKLEVFR